MSEPDAAGRTSMLDERGIGWAEESWNPTTGCTKVSPGRVLDGREWVERPAGPQQPGRPMPTGQLRLGAVGR